MEIVAVFVGDEYDLVSDESRWLGIVWQSIKIPPGKFHDEGDAKWIVIRGQLRRHNDTPFGWPAPSRPIGHLRVGRPQDVLSGSNYY
jgi:hypothetical protein